jgi:hypothetical protein
MSKAATNLFATLFVIAALAFITTLAGMHDPVPVVMTAIVVGAMAGQFATLNVPSSSYMYIAAAALAAIGILTGLKIDIPQAIYAALSTSLLGHFALTLPAISPPLPPTVAASGAIASPAPPPAPPAVVAPAPVPADTGPMLGG